MPETEPQGGSRPSPPSNGGRRRPPGSPDAAKIVRRYLSALDSSKPGRSVRRTAESVASRIVKIDELIVSADPLTRLHLTQERIDLHAEHVRLTTTGETKLADVEQEFVRVARGYGDRHGITYAAWRQVGVEADVLDKAGIHRTRPPIRPERPTGAPSGRPAAAPAASPGPSRDRPTPAIDEPPASTDPAADLPEPAVPAAGSPPAASLDDHEDTVAELPFDSGAGDDIPTGDDTGAGDDAPSPRNGAGAHDSPPMRRRRLNESRPGD